MPEDHTREEKELKISKMSDEDCLKKFLEFLETRVTLDTGFVTDPDTGNITHQVVQISCGEYVTVSHPEPLAIALRPATGAELGATVN